MNIYLEQKMCVSFHVFFRLEQVLRYESLEEVFKKIGEKIKSLLLR